MKSSSIFRSGALLLPLLFVHFATCQNVGEIAMDPALPMDVLHGEYTLENKTTENYIPTWAAVWKMDKKVTSTRRFSVAMWPITYCHAVYLCPVPAVDYGQENFKTTEGMCEDTYIKYYPHAKKMLIKTSKSGAEETVYWMNNKMAFTLKPADKLTFFVLESLPESFTQYQSQMDGSKTRSIDFKDQDLLILTNSRMCQVQRIGGEFYPFFQKAIQADTSDTFPNWLYDPLQLVRSDALYPNAYKSAETTDLLAPLKEKKFIATGKIGGYERRCDSQEGTSGLGSSNDTPFMKESVMSYTILRDLATSTGAVYEFSLEVNECHWFRVWFANSMKNMSDYKDAANSEFVTFFLNEGFYVGPSSDKAFPLPDAADMSIFRFRAFDKSTTRTPDDPNLVEIAMGSRRHRNLFREYITPSNYIKDGFELHVIMAPMCDLKLAENGGRRKTYPNNFIPEKCRFSYLKD